MANFSLTGCSNGFCYNSISEKNVLLEQTEDFNEKTKNDHLISQLFFHFLLDKTYSRKYFDDKNRNQFTGSVRNIPPNFFKLALKDVIDLLKQDSDNQKLMLGQTLEHPKDEGRLRFQKLESLLEMIDFYIYCGYRLNNIQQMKKLKKGEVKEGDSLSLLGKAVAQKIQDLPIGQSILIPSGCLRHGTLIKLQKNENGTFNLFFYNTGNGVEGYHKRWVGTNHFQTYFTIENIQPQHFLQSGTWQRLFHLTCTSKNMDPVYKYIKEDLGRNRPVIFSPHKEDYEKIQHHSTCAGQVVMSWFREECLNLKIGAKQENLGFYNMIKLKLLHQINQAYSNRLEPSILEWMEKKTQKHAAHLELAQAAADMETFKALCNEYASLIEQPELERIDPSSLSIFARFQLLSSCAKKLSKEWLDHSEKMPNSEKNQVEKFASTLVKNELFLIENIKEHLSELYRNHAWERLGKLWVKYERRLPVNQPLYEWFLETACDLNKEPSMEYKQEEFNEKFIFVFNHFEPQVRNHYKNKLLEILKTKKEHVEFASSLEAYLQEPTIEQIL